MNILFRILFIILLTVSSENLFAQFGGGSGTERRPYQIRTKEHLRELSDSMSFTFPNSLENRTTGRHYRLMNDITDSVDFILLPL